MSRRTSRILGVIGLLALVVGGVWIGQGANLIPGSSMTGSQMWLVIGIVVALVGVALLATSLMSRPRD